MDFYEHHADLLVARLGDVRIEPAPAPADSGLLAVWRGQSILFCFDQSKEGWRRAYDNLLAIYAYREALQ